MQVLWVGTKSPWPSDDGGRLVAALTITALRQSGLTVEVVTADDRRRRSWLMSAAIGLVRRRPAAVVRHAPASLVAAVAAAIEARRPDVVHVEQLQAWDGATPARAAGLPVVLRLHNVESEVWRAAARRRQWWGPALAWQARTMARWEASVIREAAATVALCAEDARLVETAVPGISVPVVDAPAPHGTSGDRSDATPLAGAPPCIWLGTPGWASNDDGETWLRHAIWPAIRARVADARLHLFSDDTLVGLGDDGIHIHARPAASADAFAPGSVLLLPLRDAPGIRMRVLEAWARDVPVIATTAACRGLRARHERNVLLADDAEGFAHAVVRLTHEPHLWAALVDGGRRAIDAHHAPAAIAAQLTTIYRGAIARRASR